MGRAPGQNSSARERGICGNRCFRGLVAACLILALIPALGLVLDRLYPLNLEPGQAGPPQAATIVLARDGTPLRAFADPNGVWRFPARTDQVSPFYLQALLAYEDRWFWHHPGINPLALARALVQNLAQGRVVSGGSTLTMQVARILAAPDKTNHTRSIPGKICQMLRAIQLECHLTKNEILGLYLTCAPFGANIEGVRAAAYTWLGRDAAELTRAEAALLAVLPQAPSLYRPDRHPQRAARARDKVLDRLARFKVWPASAVAAAKAEPVIPYRFPSPMDAPLAARRLRREAVSAAVIPTLLDPDLQTHVAALLRDYMAGLPPRQSGAVLVVNHRTLAVHAYAGSADFFDFRRQGHVDMVRAVRSPGSALKPFAYGLALDAGLIHSHSLLLDVPRFGQPYDPGNFTGGFNGPVTAAQALQDSLNLPAVQILEALGPARFHDRLKNAGASLGLAGSPNLSMVLGGMGTNLESLVTLYTALARQGLAGRPRLRPLDPVQERYLMSPGAAFIIRKILSRPLPGQEGIARLAGERPLAWKTGTSYGFRDAWALGIQGEFVVGVWVGRPDGSPSPGHYGAVTAVPLMAQVMESLPRASGALAMPQTVTQETICWPSGLAEAQAARIGAGACVRRHKAWILNHQIPPTMTGDPGQGLVRTFWVDQQGRRASPLCGGIKKQSVVLWPWQAQGFLPDQWQGGALIPDNSPQCPDLPPVRGPGVKIVSVTDQSILARQPGEAGSPALPLQALNAAGHCYWFLNRRPLGRDITAMPLPLPGLYQLAVVDESGRSNQVGFRVIAAGDPL